MYCVWRKDVEEGIACVEAEEERFGRGCGSREEVLYEGSAGWDGRESWTGVFCTEEGEEEEARK